MIKKALFLFVVFNIAASAYCGRMFTKPDGSVWIVTNRVTHNLVVSVNGDVGIGTAEPSGKFQVVANVSPNNNVIDSIVFTRTAFGTNGTHGIGGQFLFQAENTSGNVVNSASLGGMLAFAQTGLEQGVMLFNTGVSGNLQEAMRIDQNGNVGVGTANPTCKLDVDGSICADGLILGSTSFQYFGDVDVEGSWRIGRDADDLVFERFESGNWEEKGRMTAL